MAVRANCPHCGKNLMLRQAPVPGHRILCSGCKRTFSPIQETTATQAAIVPAEVPASGADAASPALQSRSTILSPQPSRLGPLVPLPAPSAPPAAASLGPHRAVLLAAVLGGLLLLTGSTALALFLAGRGDSKPEQKQMADQPAATTLVSTTVPDLTPPTNPARSPDRAANPDNTPDDLAPTPPTDIVPRSPDRPLDPTSTAPGPPTRVRFMPEAGRLPHDVQLLVNKAIDNGVEYLKAKQLVNGTWDNSHTTALAALPGLTLLECGVPSTDPRVQKAARFVRTHAPRLNNSKTTYELSLALLFLDRLGDPQDRPLIRTISLRLVAGQLAEGGWSYTLPLLQPEDENQLLRFLEQTRPRVIQRPVKQPAQPKPIDKPDPLDRFVPVPGSGDKTGPAVSPGETSQTRPGSSKPFGPKKQPDRKDPGKDMGKKADRPLSPAEVKKAINKLPPPLRKIPAVEAAAGKAARGKSVGRPADNSNTQFATLALWVARRNGLPVERSIDLLARRFRNSQLTDGTWRYLARPKSQATAAMTGAGLLGLAVGHGVDADRAPKTIIKDARVDKGLKALGGHIGKPFGADLKRKVRMVRGRLVRAGRPQSPINLYFLWTVERVGVLYRVHELDGKDWYRWGVELLLHAQADDGSWHEQNYHGSTRPVDTCFALLFLKRANLAADLTKKLQFVVEGKRPAAPGGSLKGSGD